MNKIVAIIVCIFCIQTMNAQTTLSINFLKSNKWILLEDGVEEGKIDTTIVSFDNKKMYASEHLHYIHPKSRKVIDKTLKIDYTYYLSNAVSDSYDAGKVGKATTGNFITVHNVSSTYVDSGDYTTFEITKKSNSEIVLTLCSFPSDRFNKIGRKFLLIKKQ